MDVCILKEISGAGAAVEFFLNTGSSAASILFIDHIRQETRITKHLQTDPCPGNAHRKAKSWPVTCVPATNLDPGRRDLRLADEMCSFKSQ
jgi:hypothetical protein